MQKRFTDIFINRPVFATCISLGILLAGIVSFTKLDVRLFPKIDASVIQVEVSYPGTPSEVMEGFVATPIEEAVSKVDGVDYVTSSSTQGNTNVTINYKLGYNIDKAMTDVSAAINAIRGNLPIDIYPPVISKSDPNAMPILWIPFTSTNMDDKQLTDYIIRVVQPQLQTITGVSNAMILGEREYAMRIWLDPHLMAAQKVTAADVYGALKQQNVIAPAGTLNSKYQELSLYSSTDLKTAKEFNDIVIRSINGKFVRVKDIGQAVLGAADTDFSLKVNGKRAIFVAITAKPNANPLDVVKSVKKVLPNIRSSLPKGVSFNIFADNTTFISASIHEVVKTILEACIFVFLVIFLMLGSLRTVLIPVITIPLSLAGAVVIMHALGFSMNLMTLLAFVLAVGLVVDDAIVVLENIHRHLEVGETPKQAAILGAREIAFPVITMTLTLIAVYAPIGFMRGLTGELFTEFAFTLAGAVLISGIIALTLSPMMCSKIYRQGGLSKGLAGIVDKLFTKLRNGYKKTLRLFLKLRYLVVIVALVVYALCYFLYAGLQHELVPPEDFGIMFSIVQAPTGANLDYTEQQTESLAAIYKKYIPEMEGYMVVNGFPMGVNSAFSLIKLTDWNKRKRTAMQIKNAIFGPMWMLPGIEAFPSLPSGVPGAGGFTPVEFILSTTGSYDELLQVVNKFMQQARQWGGVINVTTDLKINNPQINININRDRAADLGINMAQISTSLNTFLSKPRVNYFNIKGRGYQVLPRLYRKYRDIPTALNNLNVRTKSGNLVPLNTIADLDTEVVPQQRNHFQLLRSATVRANLPPGVSLGTALGYLSHLAKKSLPQNIQINYAHESRQYMQAAGAMLGLTIFALIFIYLVLAAQFESFRDPFVVMLSVPLAICGALIGIYLCKGTMNIYTQIGLVTLIGLITKHGILIVEFANQQQLKGVPFHEAIINGAAERLRPVLMTTFTMMLGALPLALASGASAVSRTQIGFVIIFGMGIGTFFTLFIIPVAYYLLAAKIKDQG